MLFFLKMKELFSEINCVAGDRCRWHQLLQKKKRRTLRKKGKWLHLETAAKLSLSLIAIVNHSSYRGNY